MLLVRKTLTEIFLEVTDEKIEEISKSTLEKYRQKGSCAIAISLKIIFIFLKTKSKRNCAMSIQVISNEIWGV